MHRESDARAYLINEIVVGKMAIVDYVDLGVLLTTEIEFKI